MAARAISSATISFGLVSIPVKLYTTTESSGQISFNMLHQCGTRVKQQYWCPTDEKVVPREEMVKGYEFAKGKYVTFTNEEIKALEAEATQMIEIREFLPLAQVDPLHFERAYYLAPGSESAKAYRLLADVMERTGRAGIATFVMRGKEYLVAILAESGILRAETLRFADEVRSADDVGLPETKKVKAADVQRFTRAIQARAEKTLDPDELGDPWTEKLVALAEKKRKRGEDVVEAPAGTAEEEQAEVIDLMAVLKRSLGTTAAAHPRTRRAAASRRPAARRSSSGGKR